MPRSRTSFVLLIMALLASGVVVTLWLSTQAIAGSYKLDQLHEKNSELSEQVGKLDRTVTKRESATWLADHAKELGMVPGDTAAKLVVDSDGSVRVVGDAHKVTAPDSDKDSAHSERSRDSDDGDSDHGDSDDSDADDSDAADSGSDDGDSDDSDADDDDSDDSGSDHSGSDDSGSDED